MRDRWEQLSKKVTRLEASLEAKEETLAKKTDELEELTLEAEASEEALAFLQEVAAKVQSNLEDQISSLVSLAISDVFPDPYEFKCKFVTRRGQTECDFLLERDGEEYPLVLGTGGGVTDIAAFALRLAFFSISQEPLRKTIILDEPFRFVSANLLPDAAQMLHSISKKLGLQIIMVSHSDDLIEGADRVFRVRLEDGISRVEVEQ